MAEAKRSASPSPDPRDRSPAILIVEDEVLIRFAIADYLRECGFKVYEAGTAAEAVALLESDKASIDLVFTDIRMPGDMNGFGLAQWVRQNRPGLPVVLTSGDAKKSAAAKELCENEPFFAKPYDLKQVVTHLRAIVEAKAPKGEGD